MGSAIKRVYSRLTPAQKEVYDKATSRRKKSSVKRTRPRNISQLRASGGSPRKATLEEKTRYATRTSHTTNNKPNVPSSTPTPSLPSSGSGLPAWARRPLGTRKGVTIYKQTLTPTYYFKKNNTIYRYDSRNNRFYLLDSGIMSAGKIVARENLPSWVKAVLWD